MIVLEKKYVFHIPLYKYLNGNLEELDVDTDDLLVKLSESGFDALYITKTKGYYKSRSYDELLITLFARSDEAPEEIFIGWFKAKNHIFKQEALAYECQDEMHIIQLKF